MFAVYFFCACECVCFCMYVAVVAIVAILVLMGFCVGVVLSLFVGVVCFVLFSFCFHFVLFVCFVLFSFCFVFVCMLLLSLLSLFLSLWAFVLVLCCRFCIVTGKQIGRASCRERVCLYV